MPSQNRKTGRLLQVTAAVALASGLSACSIVPEWADPTSWFGDDVPAAADVGGTTPDLASLPAKPGEADGAQAVADSLAADRKNAQYSGETLRAGEEAAAAPPPDLPGVSKPAVAEAMPSSPEPAAAAPSAPVQTAQTDAQTDKSVLADPNPASSAIPGTLPSVGSPVQTASLPAGTQPAMAPQTAAPTVAPRVVEGPLVATEPKQAPKAAKPAAPAEPAAVRQGASLDPSDAALGFQPSSAPALDSSVAEFVPAPIIQHYQATAMRANMPEPTTADLVTPAHAEGGPLTMDGDVVANLDVIQNPQPGPSYNPASPAAVVYFPSDRTSLDAEARAQVVDIAAQFKTQGSSGFVRVVGHSSSRTADMPVKKHLELIFRKSQDRANAVAQALIRAGVPAKNILVEAVGDTQPVYYESMPKGEDGNRRAEIFLQG